MKSYDLNISGRLDNYYAYINSKNSQATNLYKEKSNGDSIYCNERIDKVVELNQNRKSFYIGAS